MGNNYLIAGFFIVILFNIVALLLNRDKFLPQKTSHLPARSSRTILNVTVFIFQVLGVVLVFCGFALYFGIIHQPYEALGLLKDSLIFILPVLLVGYFLLRKRAARKDTDFCLRFMKRNN